MSTDRNHRGGYPKGPDGRPLCRWCNVPVLPPRQTFCGAECVHAWKLRSNAQYRREQTFERDMGVCRACGLDCRALENRLGRLLYEDTNALDAELARHGMTRRTMGPLDQRVPVSLKGKIGRPVDPDLIVWEPGRTFWESDHIVAVVDGGGGCGLDNLQTLCVFCHRQKTRELAARRAEERRKPPEDLFPARVLPPKGLFDPD